MSKGILGVPAPAYEAFREALVEVLPEGTRVEQITARGEFWGCWLPLDGDYLDVEITDEDPAQSVTTALVTVLTTGHVVVDFEVEGNGPAAVARDIARAL